MKIINPDKSGHLLFSPGNKGDESYDFAVKLMQQCNGTKSISGLQRLVEARKKKFVVLSEKVSDCQILWLHKIPAICVPRGTCWQENKDAHHFIGIEIIYLMIGEYDGANNMVKELSESSIKDRIKVLQIRNLNKLNLLRDEKLKKKIRKFFAYAKSLKDYTEYSRKKQRKKLYAQAKEIAECKNILDMFAEDIEQKGLVGEKALVKGLYLALITGLFDDPVNVVVKGESSSGKSHVVDSVLKYFPPEAYLEATSFTEKTLIHSPESFKHRFIIIYEAAGAQSDFIDYLMRTLISKKEITYQALKGPIKKEGPTGFITTTTSKSLNFENETRYLSYTSDNSPEQTKAVILSKSKAAKAGSHNKSDDDWEHWQAFHRWLALKRNYYRIPYAVYLGELVACGNTRTRRDITTVHALIGAHAIIHQKNRERDSEGFIIANKDDYSAVYKIIGKTLTSTVKASPSDIEIVNDVESVLREQQLKSISMTKLAKWLGVDKGTVSRNVKGPITKGYLVNKESKKGVKAKIALGMPIGKSKKVLPLPKTLWKAYAKGKRIKKK